MAVNTFNDSSTDQDWSNSYNWSEGVVPSLGDGHTVVIDANCSLTEHSTTDGTLSTTTINIGNTFTLGNYNLAGGTDNVVANGAISQGSGILTCADFTLSSTMTATHADGVILFTGNVDISGGTGWTSSTGGAYGPYMRWDGAVAKTFTAFGGANTPGGDSSNSLGAIDTGNNVDAKLTIVGGSSGSEFHGRFNTAENAGSGEFELTGGRQYHFAKGAVIQAGAGGVDITVLKGDGTTNTRIYYDSGSSGSICYWLSNNSTIIMNGDSTSANTGYEIYGIGTGTNNAFQFRTIGAGSILKGIHLHNSYLDLGDVNNTDFVTNATIEDISNSGTQPIWAARIRGVNNLIKIKNFTSNTGKQINLGDAGTRSLILFEDSSFDSSDVVFDASVIDKVVSKNHNDVANDAYVWCGENMELDSDTLTIAGQMVSSTDNIFLQSLKTYTLTSTTAADVSSTFASITAVSGSTTDNNVGGNITVNGLFDTGVYLAGANKTTVLGNFNVDTFTHESGEISLSSTGTQTVSGSAMAFHDLTQSTGTVIYSEGGTPFTVANTFTHGSGTTKLTGSGATFPALAFNDIGIGGSGSVNAIAGMTYTNTSIDSGTFVIGSVDLSGTGTGTLVNNGTLSIGAGSIACSDISGSGTYDASADGGNILFTGNVDLESATWDNSHTGAFGPALTFDGTVANKYIHCFGANVCKDAASAIGSIAIGGNCTKKLTVGGGSDLSGDTAYLKVDVGTGGDTNAEIELTGGRTYTNPNTNRTIIKGGTGKLTVLKGDGTNNTIIENTFPQNAAHVYITATSGNVTFNGDSDVLSTGYILRGHAGYRKYLGMNGSPGTVILKGIRMEHTHIALGMVGNADYTSDTLENIVVDSVGESAADWFIIPGNNVKFKGTNLTNNTNANLSLSGTGTLSNALFINSSFDTDKVVVAGTNIVVSKNHNEVSNDAYVWCNSTVELDSDTFSISGQMISSTDNVYLVSDQTYTLTSTTASDMSSTFKSLSMVVGATIDNNVGGLITINETCNLLGTYIGGDSTTLVHQNFVCGTFTKETSGIHLSTTGTITVSGSQMDFYGLELEGSGTYIFSENGNPLAVSDTFTPNTSLTKFTGTSTTGALTFYNLEIEGTVNASALTCNDVLVDLGATFKIGSDNVTSIDVTANGALEVGSATWSCQDFTVSSTVLGTADGTILYTGNMDLSGCTGWTRNGSGTYGPTLTWNGTVAKSLTVFGGAGKAGDDSNKLGMIDYGTLCRAKLTIDGGVSGNELYLRQMNINPASSLANAEIELTGGRTYIGETDFTFYLNDWGRKLTVKEGDGTTNTILRTTSSGYPVVMGCNADTRGILTIGTTGDIDTLYAADQAVQIDAPNAVVCNCYFALHSVGDNVIQGLYLDDVRIFFNGTQDWATDTISEIKFNDLSGYTYAMVFSEAYNAKLTNVYMNTATGDKNIKLSAAADVYANGCTFAGIEGAGAGYIVSKNHNEVSDDTYIYSNVDIDLDSNTLDIAGQALTTNENIHLMSAQTYTITAQSLIDNSGAYASLTANSVSTTDNNAGSDMVVNGVFNVGTYLAGANKTEVKDNFTVSNFVKETSSILLSTNTSIEISGSEMEFNNLELDGSGGDTFLFSEDGVPLTVTGTFNPGSASWTEYSGTSTTANLIYDGLLLSGAVTLSSFECKHLSLSGTIIETSNTGIINGSLGMSGAVTEGGFTYLFDDGGSHSIQCNNQAIGTIQSTGGSSLAFINSNTNPTHLTVAVTGAVTVVSPVHVRVQTAYSNSGSLTVNDGGYLHDNANRRIHAYEGTVEGDNTDVKDGSYSLLMKPNSLNYVQVTYNHNGGAVGFNVTKHTNYNFVFKTKTNRSFTSASETLKMVISTEKSGGGTTVAEVKVDQPIPNKWTTKQKGFNSGDYNKLFVTWLGRRALVGDPIDLRVDNSYLEAIV